MYFPASPAPQLYHQLAQYLPCKRFSGNTENIYHIVTIHSWKLSVQVSLTVGKYTIVSSTELHEVLILRLRVWLLHYCCCPDNKDRWIEMNIINSEPKLSKLTLTPIIITKITASFNNLFSFNYNNYNSHFSLISKSRKILKGGLLFIMGRSRTGTHVVYNGMAPTSYVVENCLKFLINPSSPWQWWTYRHSCTTMPDH